MMKDGRISLEAALKAQGALRADAGLEPETFPVAEFVGMISDEIEQLRKRGRSDEQIAEIIRQHSPIEISAAAVTKHYAPPEARNFWKE